jgi:hypothetical protein
MLHFGRLLLTLKNQTRLEVFRQALALSENIRLGWKGLPGSNTLAYYEQL